MENVNVDELKQRLKVNVDELKQRLADAKMKSGYDDRHACCWQGYLAALLEWGLITPNEYGHLSDDVPVDDPDPSLVIFLG
jgi:hypothetical protein